MWPFTTRKALAPVMGGLTDWHCHLLPGVDDGVRTLERTLAILDRYGQMGVGEVWLTPHIMEDIPNTTARLRERFGELREAYRGAIRLHLASENMLDNLFDERLEAGDLLPLGSEGRHLLVETSYFTPPMGLYDTLARIKQHGYIPVLAHPERYVYMDDKAYRRVSDMGVLFQLNLLSTTGMYGHTAQDKARRLLRDGRYTLCGTDLHSERQLDSLAHKLASGEQSRVARLAASCADGIR